MIGSAHIGSIGSWNISHSQYALTDYSEKLFRSQIIKIKISYFDSLKRSTIRILNPEIFEFEIISNPMKFKIKFKSKFKYPNVT